MDMLWHAGLSNAVWAGGLAVLAALVGRWGRRPALTHGLWVLVLVKLITPPFWSLALPRAALMTPDDGIAARTDVPTTALAPARQLDEISVESGAPTPERAPQPDGASSLPDSVMSEPAPAIPWTTALLALWFTGSAAWFVLVGWRVARFRKLLRHAQSAPAAVNEQVRQLAQELGLRRPPAVWLIPGAVSPMLWAILGRPRLLLPAALWERLANDQRAALLAHELAHLRRRDHWVRWLELMATGLYWWHPVVWWARRAIERTEEECCDAWVVWVLPQAARAYAEALLETVDFLSEVRCPLPPAVSGIGHVHFLRRRLAMIMRGTCARSLSRPGAWALIGLGALVLPLLPGLGTRQSAAAAADEPPGAEGRGARRAPPLLSRGQEEAKPGADRPAERPAPDPRVRRPGVRQPSEEIESARDDVELLAVQLEGKRAELKEAEVRLAHAARQREQMQKLYEKGTVAEGVMAKNRDDVDLAKAQVESKAVQIKEAELRLNQAKRRLTRLQAPSSERRGVALERPADGSKAAANARAEKLRTVLDEYQMRLKDARKLSAEEVKEINELLDRLKSEMSTLEGGRGARRTVERKSLVDDQKLRQELDKALKALEQAKARAPEQMQTRRALVEAERQRAEAEAANAREAVRARVLEKKAAEQQRFVEKGLSEARPGDRKRETTPQLKAVEDRLDALSREMEALKKEIRDLARRQGAGPSEKLPPTTPKPPAPPAKR